MNVKILVQRIAAIALPALLGARGGSDSVDTPAPPAALSIGGTVATSVVIANGTVTARCAAGAPTTAATAANGSYSVSVTSGTLPCVLQATSAYRATTLHSVATGTGTSATADITPLTQLVMASPTGADPAALFTAFGGSIATAVTSAAVASAQAAVVATLATAGVEVGTLGDLVTGPLTAATSTTNGNAYDTALDTLRPSWPRRHDQLEHRRRLRDSDVDADRLRPRLSPRLRARDRTRRRERPPGVGSDRQDACARTGQRRRDALPGLGQPRPAPAAARDEPADRRAGPARAARAWTTSSSASAGRPRRWNRCSRPFSTSRGGRRHRTDRGELGFRA